MSNGPKILIVVPDSFSAEQAERVAAGHEPKIDMLELARRLDADVLSYDSFREGETPALDYRLLKLDRRSLPAFPAKVRRGQKLLLTLAREGWKRSGQYDLVFLTGEDLAIPFASFCALQGKKSHTVAIGHYLNPLKKSLLLHHDRLGKYIDRWVLYSHVQHLFALERLRIPNWKLELIPFHADSAFYAPGPSQRRECDLVVAAGFERRDYATLFAAARESRIRLELGIGSPWSRFRRGLPPLPSRATNRFRSREELRDLYRRATAVVVPLYNTDFQAGISVAIEAMSTGAPLVLSRTRGLEHLLRDGIDGLYVQPGNPHAIVDAVSRLQVDPNLGQSLGAAARAQVLGALSTNHFIERLSWIFTATLNDERSAQFYLIPSHCTSRGRMVA